MTNPYGFEAGRLVCTKGMMELMQQSIRFSTFVSACVERYLHEDWGDVDDEDWKQNDLAVRHGGRIMACYRDGNTTVWFITEAARDYTTILLPDEY